MKFPFHVTLLTLLLGLLILTGAAIGFTSYWNASSAVQDLSQQVLGHAEKRIDQRVNHLLLGAIEQCESNRHRLESTRFAMKEHGRLAFELLHVMKRNRWYTYLGFTEQATGDTLYVKQEPGGALSVLEGHWNVSDHKLEIKEYQEANYPNGDYRTKSYPRDSREHSTFTLAKSADKQIWTETRMLRNTNNELDRPGLTCAVPVKKDGGLLGVFSTTFYLSQLCDFLREFSEGEEDFPFTPFIVEYRSDDTRSVIAHPNNDLLEVTRESSEGKGDAKLRPAEEVRDPLVRAFLKELDRQDSTLNPTNLKARTEAELQHLASLRFTHDGVDYCGTYRCLSTNETPDWLICIIVPESSILARVQKGNRNTVFIVFVIGVIAVAVSLLVALQVARPLRRLARQTEAIGQFHLAAEPVAHSIVREVDRLAVAMEHMKLSLRSFRKYVPAEVVRALLAAGQDATLGGERRTITIYFSDIADFTSISEQLTPEQLVTQLAEYLSAQSEQVLETHGTVDKYIGDAIMAFWGAPVVNSLQALAACTAAIRNQEKLQEMREKWKGEGKPLFFSRIGINTGEVIVGNFGSSARLNYTVIGDPVNLASRLEGLNKHYGTAIMISESTYEAAKEGIVARPLDWVSVKGKKSGVLVYELIGLKGEVSESIEKLVELYTHALASYRKQDWTGAIELFEQVLQIKPDDKPAKQMLKRCQDYQANSPGQAWDGVHRMVEK
jgi:adenylate cyclase